MPFWPRVRLHNTPPLPLPRRSPPSFDPKPLIEDLQVRPARRDILVKTCLVALSVLLPIALCSCQETEADDARNDSAAEHPPIDATAPPPICLPTLSPTTPITTRSAVPC